MSGSTDRRAVLATTAIEDTWGSNGEPIVFLGEWCKRYSRRHTWSERETVTLPFHWDDRGKLDRDYQYLESLHHRLLELLTAALNGHHGVFPFWM